MSDNPGTKQRIREAAFRALSEHGYADLTIKDIGEELGQNPSIIYHYFDSKDELLLSMLDDFVGIFVGQRLERPVTDAGAELRTFVEQVLHPSTAQLEAAMHSPPADIETATARVFVELWAHATWDDAFREETTRVDGRMRDALTHVIEAGIENGQFRPVDPELTATHVLFLLKQGLHTRSTTNWADADEQARALIDGIIADISADS
ncbi:TetR/AcrR family transcriptional regulator [Haloferax sp. Atlit-6N]|uniref:TetR family transcriptional regulator n=1 Tax=Haloferax gibbonsii (strain ATCC 33959 / DSM 4427 / JCM 8863 / NBRC 102184 / NCIMB 2188 / Ma 2.38) TaxID=1227459 RepID=M0GYM0_HALGM|nr:MULTISPECIES: TetR/AcrR family transcriptional regulator [Haloferax]ELZ75959.1 TetR family transcriptional regulator [Haloferax gibbonsii ATCC 33959]RDZ50642.1 TetR/AcrR family transcriptional regulator [Haloferax sp. Atlit-4N]REA01691.1 TetR/AcrR family transcriptional regulator [Haloferax sp. Atlit-6N]